MNESLASVFGSLVEVFGLIGAAYLYGRRFRPDVTELLRLTAGVFIPCLVFTSVLESQVQGGDTRTVILAASLQIGIGLILARLFLPRMGLREARELALPIAFVNSANLPLPLVLANFGPEAFSLGMIYFLTTNVFVFTIGMFILHGRAKLGIALKEPVLIACVVAFVVKLSPWSPSEAWLRLPRLVAQPAIPLMLVLFGIALSRTRLQHWRPAVAATVLRYLGGTISLVLILAWIQPTGILRAVLVLYMMLPSAVVTVVLTQRSGRGPEGVASAALLTTLVSAILLPILLVRLTP